jgi:hypothetical protein
VSLDPAVNELVERGELSAIMLVRFDLPGKTIGYHNGGRPYTHNGLVYLPNRYLAPGDQRGAIGTGVTRRTLTFSGIPGTHADDVIASIENYAYLNAPVITTVLAGVPETNEVAGILLSSVYEIEDVTFARSPVDAAGEFSLRVIVQLEPPGRTARGSTHARRSLTEQQYDNDPADTCLEYTSVAATVPRKFGQLRR